MPSEIVADFQLTPELWYRASRCVLQRQHRFLSPKIVGAITLSALLILVTLDHSGWLDDGLGPVLILLNVLVPLACLLLCLTPVLLRLRFDAVYRRLPESNRRVIWRFSPFRVSAEGGLTRFEGGWDDLREIVATPEFFLVFRKERSAGVIPVSAFDGPETLEDFVFLARSHAPKYVEAG